MTSKRSFRDTGSYCRKSYPCRHSSFEVVLKDERKCTVSLQANDIYVVLKGLKGLKDIGQEHEDWKHFKGYANLGSRGWTIRSADEVLTEIFSKK